MRGNLTLVGALTGLLCLDPLNPEPPLHTTSPPSVGVVSERGERRSFIITFYCSCAICTKQYSPERGGKGLTRMGNHPQSFRTAATGDPALLGRWVLLEDLGGWLHINDTGKLMKNQLDIYVGQGPHMHKAAARLGRQEWIGELR